MDHESCWTTNLVSGGAVRAGGRLTHPPGRRRRRGVRSTRPTGRGVTDRARGPCARRHGDGEGHPGLRQRFYSLSSADSIQPCLVFSSVVT